MLDGRTVIVTGAGRGLGFGVTEAILKHGGNAVLAEVDAALVSEARSKLSQVDGARFLAVVADVMDEASVDEVFDTAVQHFGTVDGLVNNAGVIRLGSALESSSEDWSLQLDVNVRGVFHCSRAFAARAKRGAIVNIASNAGKVGYPNMAGYNASKAAVINLTRTLSAEWADKDINVNAVCPGGVLTPMLAGVAEHIGEQTGGDPSSILGTMVPKQMGRHIHPEEVGDVVVFLLSDYARIIRGQSINVDGGDTPY